VDVEAAPKWRRKCWKTNVMKKRTKNFLQVAGAAASLGEVFWAFLGEMQCPDRRTLLQNFEEEKYLVSELEETNHTL
jgi:hypothetical protein